MSDALIRLIQSPPAVLAAGGVLFGVVWGLFKGAESLLNDDTKLEITVWLLDRKRLSPTFESWPDTFAKVFDRIFTPRHLSWACFLRATAASATLFSVTLALQLTFVGLSPLALSKRLVLASLLLGAAVDYLSLLETRACLPFMRRHTGTFALVAVLLLDLLFTLQLSNTAGVAWTSIQVTGRRFSVFELSPLSSFQAFASSAAMEFTDRITFFSTLAAPRRIGDSWIMYNFALPYYASALFTSIWLWLYAGSGFLIKAARRWDTAVEFMNVHMDIEKKPLHCIGAVAGALMALGYWALVIVSRMAR